jgi:hypothetical protein
VVVLSGAAGDSTKIAGIWWRDWRDDCEIHFESIPLIAGGAGVYAVSSTVVGNSRFLHATKFWFNIVDNGSSISGSGTAWNGFQIGSCRLPELRGCQQYPLALVRELGQQYVVSGRRCSALDH